jgi:protein Tex
VALDATGKLLENDVLYATLGDAGAEKAKKKLLGLIEKYSIKLIAIGNGTASRETESFVREACAAFSREQKPLCVIVNEAGASVYSASDVAIKEFPDFDLTVRGAVSIGRRLQDPLSELVKIDPKAIGVGQYQHDVDQTALKKALEEVVESCVNAVGVDLNLASGELLRYVSGLTSRTAEAIVTYRNRHGPFAARRDLTNVPGIGDKTFEQAAGFLRIPQSKNPLDNSSVHPERYDVVVTMAASLKATIEQLIANTALLGSLNKQQFVSEEIGLPTIEDIIKELEKPGRDPREEFRYASFNDSIRKLKDLSPGMKLEGTVTNVTNFGAFVDIGVHQDGLVHISRLADRYVTDPHQVVKPGQIVHVTVVEVDADLKRISLSMKSDPSANRSSPRAANDSKDPEYRKSRPQPNPSQPAEPTLSDLDRLRQWAGGNTRKR